MNYRRPSNKKKKFEKIIYIFSFVIIIFLIFPFIISTLDIPKNILVQISTPIWNSERNIILSIKDSSSFIKNKSYLIEENNILKSRLTDILSLKLENRFLKQENIQLKQELGRSAEKDNSILATILVRPNKTVYDTLIVDVGKDDGISIGDTVISEWSTLLGEVIDTFPKSSKILLYSSSDIITNVTIGEENINAEAIGMGGSNYEINIPRDIYIATSSIIIVPNRKGLILGVVDEIKKRPQDTIQKLLFKTPINIQQLKWVTIIKKN